MFFKKYAARINDFVRKAKAQIDLPDPESRIAEIFRAEFQDRFPDEVIDDMRKAFSDSWKVGHVPITADWQKAFVPQDALEWFAKANHFDVSRQFPGYEDEIRKAVRESLEKGNRAKKIQELSERIPTVLDSPKNRKHLADIFTNLSNRAQVFGRIKGMHSAGVVSVEVVAVIDDRTSAICRIMDGKTISMQTASSFVDEWLNTPYDEGFWGKYRNPSFEPTAEDVQKYGGSRSVAQAAVIEPYRKMTGDQLVPLLGLPLPPYHFRCRTTTVMASTSGSTGPERPAAVQRTLDTEEKKIRSNDYETAIIINSSGRPLFRKKGNETTVSFSPDEVAKMRKAHVTHNHPNGSSFSGQDVFFMLNAEMAEVRAATSTHRHAIRKTEAPVDVPSLHADYEQRMKTVSRYWLSQRAAGNGEADRKLWSELTHGLWLDLAQKYDLDYERTKW